MNAQVSRVRGVAPVATGWTELIFLEFPSQTMGDFIDVFLSQIGFVMDFHGFKPSKLKGWLSDH